MLTPIVYTYVVNCLMMKGCRVGRGSGWVRVGQKRVVDMYWLWKKG